MEGIKRMVDLNGKVALITGGTSGIGEATAKYFSECGATVVITGRNDGRGKKIAEEIKGEYISSDLLDEESIVRLKKSIKEKYGRLNILVNNAGIYPKFDSLENTKSEQWDEVYSVNVKGTMSVCKIFMELLIESKGVMINNGSIAGIQGFNSGQGYAYASSKAAIIHFTKMMAKIYAKDVRINCVCPGVVDTPLYFNLDKEKMKERTPSGLLGEPEDVAKLVGFLASDDSRFIYGAVITVDGGMTL